MANARQFMAARTAAWTKSKTPAIHFEEASDGGKIITRTFGAGCRFEVDLEILDGSRVYLLGNGSSGGQYLVYGHISSRLPVDNRGVVSFTDGGDGYYVGATRTASANINYNISSLTFGAYVLNTPGNRRNHYLFGCKVTNSDGELVANLIPSTNGNLAALKDLITGDIYSANKTSGCKYVEI